MAARRGNPAKTQQYFYARGNPLRRRDPTGRDDDGGGDSGGGDSDGGDDGGSGDSGYGGATGRVRPSPGPLSP